MNLSYSKLLQFSIPSGSFINRRLIILLLTFFNFIFQYVLFGQISFYDTTDWELGTVTELSDTCSRISGGLVNTTCKLLEVNCPGLTPIQVELRITAPNKNVTERGTIVFSSGGSGTSFYGDRTEAQILFQELTMLGFRVVDRAWKSSNGWTSGEGGLKHKSCRYATLLTWIFNNMETSEKFC